MENLALPGGSSTISFEDDFFPVIIRTGCTSTVDAVEEARNALHEPLEIKYFYEGTATLLIGSETVNVQAGDVVVINPYEFHATIDYGENKGKYHILMLGLDFFSRGGIIDLDLRNLLLGRHLSFRTVISEHPQLQEILNHIVAEAQRSPHADHFTLRAFIMLLFSILLREGQRDGESPVPKNDVIRYYNVIDPALRMIRDKYAEHFTVDQLAALCQVSKYHFCRIFRIVTGMSAMQYINNYRLKVADTMLGNTEKSISQIAFLCGFEDVSYFYRCYQKHYGFSPGQKRKNNKSSISPPS